MTLFFRKVINFYLIYQTNQSFETFSRNKHRWRQQVCAIISRLYELNYCRNGDSSGNMIPYGMKSTLTGRLIESEVPLTILTFGRQVYSHYLL